MRDVMQGRGALEGGMRAGLFARESRRYHDFKVQVVREQRRWRGIDGLAGWRKGLENSDG